MLQNIRTAMRRQIRRHSTRRASSRRRLGRLWSRLFHRGTRLRGQIPLLTPPGAAHPSLTRSHSYQAVGGAGSGTSPCSTAALGLALQAHADALYRPPTHSPPTPLSPPTPSSPLSASDSQEEEESESGAGSPEAPEGGASRGGPPPLALTDTPGPSRQPSAAPENSCDTHSRRASRKLVQGLAANLALRRYAPLGVSPSADLRVSFSPPEGHPPAPSRDLGPLAPQEADGTCQSVELPIREGRESGSGDDDESLLLC